MALRQVHMTDAAADRVARLRELVGRDRADALIAAAVAGLVLAAELARPAPDPERRVSAMGLSGRAFRLLRRAGVLTAADLARVGEATLIGMRGMGEATLREIGAAARAAGVEIGTAAED